MSTRPLHILVFDSGVGGLSIVNHLRKLPQSCYISYVADSEFFPYGMLSDEQLISRVNLVVTTMVETLQPDMVVIACNSASTLALPSLRKLLSLPVIGVVPAIKPASSTSNNKIIGLLATPGTVQREYTDDLINSFASDCQVIRVGSSQLVNIVEKKFSGQQPQINELEDILSPLSEASSNLHIDTIVLACTHFPLILEELKLALPHITHWIDSGSAIANRVQQLSTAGLNLQRNTFANKTVERATEDCVFFTGKEPLNTAMKKGYESFGFEYLYSDALNR